MEPSNDFKSMIRDIINRQEIAITKLSDELKELTVKFYNHVLEYKEMKGKAMAYASVVSVLITVVGAVANHYLAKH